ncbi:MAG: radical SAM protein [Anaerolineae bacterium]|nr:radical SAM protein [Anaerolineae bacterium]
MPKPFDFANILFAGPCNLRCPYCIGRQLNPALNRNNLNLFPLQNIDKFVELLKQHQISQIVFTGTTTDPQLYRHEARLLDWLRDRLPPVETESGLREVQFSLHTNGQLALSKMDVFNQYNRVSLSFPSFNPGTYRKMTGSGHMPDLAEIVRQAQIPVKVSCVVNQHNAAEIDEFLARCRAIGLRRIVIRQLYGDPHPWNLLIHLPQVATYHRNPVYDYHGMEVTYWNFHQTGSKSLNLFSDGTISPHYLLTQARVNV